MLLLEVDLFSVPECICGDTVLRRAENARAGAPWERWRCNFRCTLTEQSSSYLSSAFKEQEQRSHQEQLCLSVLCEHGGRDSP